MSSRIMLVCFSLFTVAAHAQNNNRVVDINPLRDGSGKIVSGNNGALNIADSIKSNKTTTVQLVPGSNPTAIRFNSLHVQCDPNSFQLNWTAIQPQLDADHFDIEQSNDGGVNWSVIGRTPANRLQSGEIAYNFSYNKALGNVGLRITSVNLAGERVSSSIVESPCSSSSSLMITPNPVSSTATVRIGTTAAASVRLTLVNNSGMILQTKETGLLAGNNPIPFDVSNLPKGYYVVSVQWNSGKKDAIKFVKE